MVEAFKIVGGNKIAGELKVDGSKNSTLPIMIATLVEKGTYILRNVPDLRDIRTLVALLESLGLEVEKLDANSYKIINNGLSGVEASYDLVKKMRASFLVMGGMLAIEKRGKVALPGGCAIGARPVDLHLKGFEALGAKINIEHGYVEATTENGLIGGNIVLDFPSVGATENIIMAAFSKTVFPLALTAAIIIFSVAPTLGKSRTIFPPINPFSVVASTYPCSIFIFAPSASKPFKCKSTGLAPIAQPPGKATFPLFSMASIPPITKNEALIFLTKS